jgi:hypothetical protein
MSRRVIIKCAESNKIPKKESTHLRWTDSPTVRRVVEQQAIRSSFHAAFISRYMAARNETPALQHTT